MLSFFEKLKAKEKKEPGKYSVAVDSPRNLAGVTAQAPVNPTLSMYQVWVAESFRVS